MIKVSALVLEGFALCLGENTSFPRQINESVRFAGLLVLLLLPGTWALDVEGTRPFSLVPWIEPSSSLSARVSQFSTHPKELCVFVLDMFM